MIKLHNLSKYYQGENNITQALHKINLEFKLGEFVAITGESGSGKSTLLNVIAGIDSYEDGELFINGEETSYFNEQDWEIYRKEKIAFIYQNYNLIDSYTVLMNVEVALVIQGLSKSERRTKAKEIIAKVGLSKRIKHRAAKLSGGEKQRLAIARALAKETDIIIADEPTGNLDSKTGEEILRLLNEVAKDKLVLVVTHNFDQVKEYATRKVRLFDGEVVEDKVLNDFNIPNEDKTKTQKTTELKQAATIASFNIFGQPRKSIFIFLVSFIIVAVVFFLYSRAMIPITDFDLYEDYMNIYPERMIIARKDRKPISEEEYNLFLNDKRFKNVIYEDRIIDNNLYGSISSNKVFDGKITFDQSEVTNNLIGRLPKDDFEIVLSLHYPEFERNTYIQLLKNDSFSKEFILVGEGRSQELFTFKVVGINKSSNGKDRYYVTESTLKQMESLVYQYELVSFDIYSKSTGISKHKVKAEVVIDPELSGNEIGIDSNFLIAPDENLYYGSKMLELVKTDYLSVNRRVYVSEELFKEINPEGKMQMTLNLKNLSQRKSIERALYKKGYYTYMPYYEFDIFNPEVLLDTVKRVVMVIGFIFSILIIYLISYLIYRLILNSKLKDYTILRIIGSNKFLISNTIRFELILFYTLAYFGFLIVYRFIAFKYDFLSSLFLKDYLIVYFVNINLALLLASRFIKRQVSKSLYTTLRSE